MDTPLPKVLFLTPKDFGIVDIRGVLSSFWNLRISFMPCFF